MLGITNRISKRKHADFTDSPLLELLGILKQYDQSKEKAAESMLRIAMEIACAESGQIVLLDRHIREFQTVADCNDFDLSSTLRVKLKEHVLHPSSSIDNRIVEFGERPDTRQLCISFVRKRTRGAIVLGLNSTSQNQIQLDDLEVLSEIMADVFEHSDIETEQRLLLEISEELGSRLRLSGIFKHIEHSVRAFFKCDGFSILERVERSESDFILRNLYDSNQSLIGLEVPKSSGGLSWWTIENKEHLLYKGELDSEGRYIVYSTLGRPELVDPFLPIRNESNILTCPIIYKGRVFGAIRIYNTKGLSYFDDDLDPELLSKIGIQAAIAIRNAEEFERVYSQKSQTAALDRIRETLNSTEPFEKVMNTCLKNSVKLVGGDMGFIVLRRLLSNKFSAPYTWKRDPSTIPQFDLDGNPEELGIVGMAVAREKYYLTTDVQNDPHFIPRHHGINSKIVVPLQPLNEEIIGALSIDSRQKGAFSENQISVLQAVANDIALYINRARFLEALTLLAKPFLKVDDVQVLYEQTLSRLSEMLGIKVASIYRLEKGDLVAKQSTKGFQEPRTIPRSTTLSWKAIETGRSQEEYDLRRSPDKLFHKEYIEKHALVSALSVPVKSNESAMGVINVYAHRPHRFSLLEKQLVELLAETLAINIENVELIQKQSEHTKELEDAFDELEEKNEDLKKANEALERADQAVANNNRLMAIHEMVTAFVHDARNSLNRISPNFLTLKEMFSSVSDKKHITDKVQEEADESVRLIASELTNLSSYFEKLNNYARVLETFREMNSVGSVIDSVLELMNPRIRNTKRIKVQKAYHKDFQFIFDKGQIEQVISNLMLNAIQAMEKKGTSLYIGTEIVRKTIAGSEKDCVRIRISDDGIGIKAEDRPKIFDAFFTTKKGQGTGFGLTLCKKIIEENHQGLIDFKSEVNKGAVFDVFLPYETEMIS